MKQATLLEQIAAKIEDLKARKAADLEEIATRRHELSAELSEAEEAVKFAAEALNIDEYEEAERRKRRAQTALKMYEERARQIEAREYIPEAESDAVIDSLLEYEATIAENLKQAMKAPVKQLVTLHESYMAEVMQAENLIRVWTGDIHANYNTRGQMYRTDPATGETTTRSDTPYPVRMLPYTGCTEAAQLAEYLTKARRILAAE